MTEPRHRRPDRRRGLRLKPRAGRRRATVEEHSPTRQELRDAAQAQRRRRSRRNITLAFLAATAMVAAAVVGSWWFGQDDASTTETTVPVAVPEEGSAALVAVLDAEDRAMSIALLTASPEDARVVLFQPSLLTTLPGFGENVLANAVRFGDEELLRSTISNLLGVRIDDVIALSAEDLAEAVGAPIVVDLPVPFIVADGTAQVVIAGVDPVGRDGAMIARLLTEPGLSDELEFLERQGAVWEGLLGAGNEDVFDVLSDGSAAIGEVVRSVAQGDPLLTSVPATRIEPTGDEERYQLDGVDAADFAGVELDYLQIAEEPRVRVEVLNGNGLIGTTRPVADRLIEFGFRVVFTDNADRDDYPMTLIIAQGRTFQDAALLAREAMRIGEISVELRQPSGVVDLTIIVGQDLPAGG